MSKVSMVAQQVAATSSPAEMLGASMVAHHTLFGRDTVREPMVSMATRGAT